MLWPRRKTGSPGCSSRARSVTACRSSMTVRHPSCAAKEPRVPRSCRAAVVGAVDGVAVVGEALREAGVAARVLGEAVRDLHDGPGLAVGEPAVDEDVGAIGRAQREGAALHGRTVCRVPCRRTDPRLVRFVGFVPLRLQTHKNGCPDLFTSRRAGGFLVSTARGGTTQTTRTRESMYAAERQQRIIAEARRAGRVEVTALADSLGVAAETVRRDLTALERRGSLRRVHGGAIPVERLEVEPTLATRSAGSPTSSAASRPAPSTSCPCGSIILDAGSTTLAVAEMLPPDLDLTVLTNSLAAATVLSTHPASRSTSSAAASAARPELLSATGPPAPSRTSSSTSRSSAPTACPSLAA